MATQSHSTVGEYSTIDIREMPPTRAAIEVARMTKGATASVEPEDNVTFLKVTFTGDMHPSAYALIEDHRFIITATTRREPGLELFRSVHR
jgi:hypothetical protein